MKAYVFGFPGSEKLLKFLERDSGPFLYPDERHAVINGSSIYEIRIKRLTLSKNIPLEVLDTIKCYCRVKEDKSVADVYMYICSYFFCSYNLAKIILRKEAFTNIPNIQYFRETSPDLQKYYSGTMEYNRMVQASIDSILAGTERNYSN